MIRLSDALFISSEPDYDTVIAVMDTTMHIC